MMPLHYMRQCLPFPPLTPSIHSDRYFHSVAVGPKKARSTRASPVNKFCRVPAAHTDDDADTQDVHAGY